MRKIVILTGAAVTLGAASAQAGSLGKPCTSAPEAQWLPMAQLQAKVEAQGYKVQKAQVRMPNGPIKHVGESAVQVALHTDVVVDINVTVYGETA